MANAKQYFENLCKEAGLDEATTSALIAATSNEKLSPKLEQLVKTATEDYQAQVGRVNALTAKQSEYEKWYGTANSQYQAALSELETLKKAGTGNGDGNNMDGFDATKYVSKDDLLKAQAEMGSRFGGLLKQVARISSRHAAKFNEELDTDAIEKIAADNNLPVEAAYEKWIGPRVEEKRKADLETQIKAAREEGAREALSKHKLPVDQAPRQVSPLFQAAQQAASATDDELLAVWNGQAA